jgi:hypothetical protein
MYADYQEFAAAFARQCRERRNAEAEAQREVDDLTKPATVSFAVDVRKTGAGAGLVFKTRNDARVADDDDSGASVERTLPARRASAKSGSEMPWWKWVDQRMDARLAEYSRELEKVIGQVVAETRAPLEEKNRALKRELKLLRHEFICLREDFALARKLHDLHSEVAEARKQVPKLPAIVDEFDARQADLEGKQARLERELAMTKDKLGKLRVSQSLTDYGLRELRKQTEASSAASIEMEFETKSSRFQVKAVHPQAAAALKEFAGQIINGQADGTLWLPAPAGKA